MPEKEIILAISGDNRKVARLSSDGESVLIAWEPRQGGEWVTNTGTAHLVPIEQIKRIVKLIHSSCEWKRTGTEFNVYETDCGESFSIEDGTLWDNNINFCPFCGRTIKEDK